MPQVPVGDAVRAGTASIRGSANARRRGWRGHRRSLTETGTGSLTLTDNAPDSPQTLQLTGAGHQPEAVLSPDPVDFGTVSLGSSAQAVLTVSNPGTDTLDLTNAQLTGADPGDFQITGLTSGCVG